jgi:hypothetical protein
MIAIVVTVCLPPHHVWRDHTDWKVIVEMKFVTRFSSLCAPLFFVYMFALFASLRVLTL